MAGDDTTPVGALSAEPSTTSGRKGITMVRYTVAHRSNTATVIALCASTLSIAGQLIWTIDKLHGRLDDVSGEQIAVGEIKRVWTEEKWRGRGIARGMYRTAMEVAARAGWPATIDHNQQRTSDGEAWATGVGGYKPPLVPPQSYAQTLVAFSAPEEPNDGEGCI
ncbi:GNAT family N-acetyltransferase [Micromonospora wenchangensis]|uniref:hypothetical protein n=1 Tax=Micromonospora wenchangensis TaxID=1185415 RepID=UPI0037F508B4